VEQAPAFDEFGSMDWAGHGHVSLVYRTAALNNITNV
jgi:hypothetical protein